MASSFRTLATATVFAVAVAAAGCSTTREAPPPPIGPKPEVPSSKATPLAAPLPLDVGLGQPPVSLGDTFIYDNPPAQWTVTSIAGPMIGWTSDSGEMQQTAWSTLLPVLRWSGEDSATNTGQRRISQLEGKFFPLKKGNRVTFMEEVIYSRPGTTLNGHWQCDVGDQSEIVVPAGKAKAWEVLCLLNGHEKRVMYYSEKIGHSVLIADTTEGGLIVRQLTGYARGRALQLPPTTSVVGVVAPVPVTATGQQK